MSAAELAPQSHDDWSAAPPPWESDTRTKQLFERIAVLEREARELTMPPDVARMRAYETTLTQVLEWLDALVEDPASAAAYDENHAFRGVCPSCHQGYRGRPRPEIDGLSAFCDRLAAQIRETMFGGTDAGTS